VRPNDIRRDEELVSLSRETRRVADAIDESAIHARLIEIADELLDLACRKADSA
jgi:hypothetical protein